VSNAGARRIVWVVDDSKLDAERASKVLARDYIVETFCDGSALLERMSATVAPDVVVLDWVMPGVTGIDVCRFLREGGQHQALGILLLTAHRHTEQIVEGLSAGANDYLAKPYEDEELRARVASLVRWRALLERAEQAEATNRRLLATAPDPLLVVSDQGALLFVNDKASRMLASPAQALLGKPLAGLIPELAGCHLPSPAGASMLPPLDVTIGARRFSPTVTAANGGSITVSLRDVTERRLLDERRLDLYSIIAHDLRTPLGAMTLRLAKLLENPGLQDNAAAVDDIRKLEERLRSLVVMINDFLEFASLEGAGDRLTRKHVALLALLHQVADDFRPLLETNQLSFEIRCTPSDSDGLVVGDARRLAQVLSNLVANAIKFTPPGGNISAHIETKPGSVEVSIRDTGAGIPAEALDNIFQRYKRAEQSIGGTGLGLMIVKEVIEAHGGAFGVESTLGVGSRFWFRLRRE
jgi:two-component system phosphate regulon sensor histidine kinase PhoR